MKGGNNKNMASHKRPKTYNAGENIQDSNTKKVFTKKKESVSKKHINWEVKYSLYFYFFLLFIIFVKLVIIGNLSKICYIFT